MSKRRTTNQPGKSSGLQKIVHVHRGSSLLLCSPSTPGAVTSPPLARRYQRASGPFPWRDLSAAAPCWKVGIRTLYVIRLTAPGPYACARSGPVLETALGRDER